MSLGPCFVKCSDGKWYRELTYRASDNTWFICFDEDEPVELVMRMSCETAPHVILRDMGIKAEIMAQGSFGSQRMFKNRFCNAKSYFIDCAKQKYPAPRPWDTHEGAFEKRPQLEGTYFGEGA